MPDHDASQGERDVVSDDLLDLSASALSEAFESRELSPVEVTRAALDRVGELDPVLNAFVLVDEAAALAQARASEARWAAGEPVGLLDGVPGTIKDLIMAQGWPTRRGSTLSRFHSVDLQDAPSVARLRAAGVVMLGKVATPEFGWKGVTDSIAHGTTRNPWSLGLTPGGSSGGSAAAVSSGMGAWSLGTDGGGSIRTPSAFTGLVGLKPTRGAAPVWPPTPFGPLSHVGPIARAASDVGLLFDVLAGNDGPRSRYRPLRPWTSATKGLRVGWTTTTSVAGADPEVAEVVRGAVAAMTEAGAEIEEIELATTEAESAFDVYWQAAVAHFLGALPAEELADVDPELVEVSRTGERLSATDYVAATMARAHLTSQVDDLFERFEVLLTPTLAVPPFEVGRDFPEGRTWGNWFPFTYPFNLTGNPAISVPCGVVPSGLPVGMQLVAPHHQDLRLVELAMAYEAGPQPADATRAPSELAGRLLARTA